MVIVVILFAVIVGVVIQKAVKKNKYATRYVALSDVDYMDGHDFEYFCADLLKYDGFNNITVTKGSNDQGVDIIAFKNGVKYAIQCKRYNNSLGNKPVQEVNTGRTIYGCTCAVVLTNSYFTKGAIQAANATGVLLWDRMKLDALIKAKQSGNTSGKHLFSDQNLSTDKVMLSLVITLVVALSILGMFALVDSSKDRKFQNDEDASLLQKEEALTEEQLDLNESTNLDQLTFTVSKMMFARHNGNLKYLDMVEDDLVNCCVYVSVVNQGESLIDLSRYDVILCCDGVEYDQMLIENPEFLFSHKELSPQESLEKLVIDFRVPKEQQYSDCHIEITFVSPSGQKATWFIR